MDLVDIGSVNVKQLTSACATHK